MLTVGVIGSYCYIGLFQCKNPDDVSVWNLHMSYPSDALTRVVVALYDSHLAKKEMEGTALLAENVKSTKSDVDAKDSLNIVLVIGESYIKDLLLCMDMDLILLLSYCMRRKRDG